MPSLMILWYYYYYHYYDIMIYDIKALRNFMSCQLFNVLLSFDQYRLLSGYLIIFNNNNHLYDNRKKLKPVALGGRCEARPASKHCWWSRRRTWWQERRIHKHILHIISSVRSSYSHPDLLVIQHPTFLDHTGPQHWTFTFWATTAI